MKEQGKDEVLSASIVYELKREEIVFF